jgi:tetratricopeptide (TPR) repeat protein
MDQLALIDQLLSDVPAPFRPDLIRLAAQYAESAAWLNQSLNNHHAGHRWTEKALTWAIQIADPIMTAWAIYRSSQHWLILGQPQRSIQRVEAAMLYDKRIPTPMRAAIRVQHAHALATAGEHREAMQLLDDAHHWAADRRPGKPEGDHGSYCTSGYIEVHRGTCLRLSQRPSEAITVLTEALPSIPPLHRQDFASALVSKAAAHVAAQQPELAAATAHTALPIARRAGSRRLLHQLAQVGAAVDAHRELADVRAFLNDLAEST